ncbi:hypothetical protein BT93_H1342 [Corymbia citriodora subsp. variegata]|nr:hypothetical protein BT93_H1342 [Corymbia citriodora subsp. variegata]
MRQGQQGKWLSNECQCAVEQKVKDGERVGKSVGLKWGRGFPLEFYLNEIEWHRNKECENGREGSEGKGTSNICVGLLVVDVQLHNHRCRELHPWTANECLKEGPYRMRYGATTHLQPMNSILVSTPKLSLP